MKIKILSTGGLLIEFGYGIHKKYIHFCGCHTVYKPFGFIEYRSQNVFLLITPRITNQEVSTNRMTYPTQKPIYRIDEKGEDCIWLEEIAFVNGECKYTERYISVSYAEFKILNKAGQINLDY